MGLILFIIFEVMGICLFVSSNMAFPDDDVFGILRCIENFKTGKVEETRQVASTKFPYNICRHPMYLGILLVIWSQFLLARYRTMNRLFFHLITTTYFLIGIRFEEKDLIRKMGESYIKYRNSKDMIVPIRLVKELIQPKKID